MPVDETLKRVDGDVVDETLDRVRICGVSQTPQSFRTRRLKRRSRQGCSRGFRGNRRCCSWSSATGAGSSWFTATRANIKLTYPEDFVIAEAMFERVASSDPRSELGFDVHAFDASRPLILAVFGFPSAPGLGGHSATRTS